VAPASSQEAAGKRNLNGDVLMLWRKDIPRNLDIAEHNWKRIATKPPGELTPYKGPQKIK
jgi:hypothetical protein